jgi:hypothetical protein
MTGDASDDWSCTISKPFRQVERIRVDNSLHLSSSGLSGNESRGVVQVLVCWRWATIDDEWLIGGAKKEEVPSCGHLENP